jgi:integrase/recombinase XerD
MAILRKRRYTWYARVRVWNNTTQKQKEIQIPLKTKSKVTALTRLTKVNKVENFIKDGTITNYTKYFVWLNNGKSEFHRFSIGEAIDEWLAYRKKWGIRQKTIEINVNGLNHFKQSVSKDYPLESVSIEQVDDFVDHMKEVSLSNTSINIHLRTLKSMLRHYWKRERLDKVPMIEQIKVDRNDPIYITDHEFQSIMELKWLDGLYKRAFYFYRETGCRLGEPFLSRLDGEWLDIPNTSKGKKPRSIMLDKSLISIFKELIEWQEDRKDLSYNAEHLSKMFKKALRHIGSSELKHFHSLRHTFAVRCLLQNIPIFKIQKWMGHSSVTTTEVYANMELKRVQQDFPTLTTCFDDTPKNAFRGSLTRGTDDYNLLFLDGRVVN